MKNKKTGKLTVPVGQYAAAIAASGHNTAYIFLVSEIEILTDSPRRVGFAKWGRRPRRKSVKVKLVQVDTPEARNFLQNQALESSEVELLLYPIETPKLVTRHNGWLSRVHFYGKQKFVEIEIEV